MLFVTKSDAFAFAFADVQDVGTSRVFAVIQEHGDGIGASARRLVVRGHDQTQKPQVSRAVVRPRVVHHRPLAQLLVGQTQPRARRGLHDAARSFPRRLHGEVEVRRVRRIRGFVVAISRVRRGVAETRLGPRGADKGLAVGVVREWRGRMRSRKLRKLLDAPAFRGFLRSLVVAISRVGAIPRARTGQRRGRALLRIRGPSPSHRRLVVGRAVVQPPIVGFLRPGLAHGEAHPPDGRARRK